MNKKNQELLQLLAIPAMMMACGGVALALATLIQALSGEMVGVAGFAFPVTVSCLVGTACTVARLLAQASDSE